jgi:hypothetical protein
MSNRRKLLILAVLALSALAAAGWFVWHRNRIPEIARMLPEGELIVYANLKPIHLWAGPSRQVQPQGEYRDFVEQTGIVIERDLDEVAMSRNKPPSTDEEWSQIYAGRFDQQRLRHYLEKISSERSTYRDHTIFTVQHEGHAVRVVMLGQKRVAVTNMKAVEPIRAIIDASYDLPVGIPLLREYYKRVPLTSLGWIIARFPPASSTPQIPLGLSFDFLNDTVTVASLRYQGDLLLEADVIGRGEDDARRIADDASNFLNVSRGAAQALGTRGVDRDVKAAFDSIQVQQKKNVAVFTATLSQRILKKLVSEAGPGSAAPVPSP